MGPAPACSPRSAWTMQRHRLSSRALDSASVAAKRGARKRGETRPTGGKPGSKRHVLTDANGIPLAVRLTAANLHDSMMLEDKTLTVGPNGLTEGLVNCEPSSVCVYRCQQTHSFKMIFWFAAKGDCTAKQDASTREAWEQGFELEWVEARDAAARMSDEADGKVIEKVLADMRNTGYDI